MGFNTFFSKPNPYFDRVSHVTWEEDGIRFDIFKLKVNILPPEASARLFGDGYFVAAFLTTDKPVPEAVGEWRHTFSFDGKVLQRVENDDRSVTIGMSCQDVGKNAPTLQEARRKLLELKNFLFS